MFAETSNSPQDSTKLPERRSFTFHSILGNPGTRIATLLKNRVQKTEKLQSRISKNHRALVEWYKVTGK
jgi:hypothetical protein